MTKTNKHKATITLAMVSAGFFLSYPFNHTFAGGLVSSACGTAMVGGLADWFAVSALVRRPLGIPFRTALIPRNREKIFNALAVMVEQELLTGENIRRTLTRYNISELLTHYLTGHDGAADVRQAFAKIAGNILIKLNPERIARVVELVVKRNLENARLSPIIADSIEWLMARGYDSKLIEFAADQLAALVKHKKMHELLVELLAEARRTYERGMLKRKAFNLLLQISPEETATLIQRLFAAALAGMKTADHPIHSRLCGWLRKVCSQLRSDEETQEKVEAWKLRQLHHISLRYPIARAIEGFRQNETLCWQRVDVWVAALTEHLDAWLTEAVKEPERRAELDAQAREVLIRWLETHHGAIGIIVKDSLNQLSNDMLVAFIEEKVGDDLQMIRINGSVVGGLAGALIFLATTWLQSGGIR